MQQRIEIAVITAAHGIRGEVVLRSFTEDPESLLSYGDITSADGSRVFRMRRTGRKGKQLIVMIEGITDRNAAEQLKNTRLYAEASALPPISDDEYYYSILEGMMVVNENALPLGRVLGLHNYGAGDIVEIEFLDGSVEMFPFQEDIFPDIDREGRRLFFSAPEVLE